MHPIIERLKDRKLVQWALAYMAGAWLVWQVIDVLGERWGLTAAVGRTLDVLLVIGLLVTLVLAWYHGEHGRQRVSGPELIMIAALLGIVGLLTSLLAGRDTPSLAGSVDANARPSVAVLPFQTLGGDEADAAFADGMHDELLHRLAQIGGLRVTSRTSVLGIRESLGLSRDIAAELGVRHLVEGTAQQAGDQVRIIVQLIDPQTDDHVWSETFTRTLSIENIFSIQSEIAAAIAGALAAELTPGERALLSDQPTNSLAAYQAFQRGNAAFEERFFRSMRLEAIASYKEAVALDPEFVDAHARLARALVLEFWFVDYDRADEAWDALARAEVLDSTRAEVHLAHGDLLYYTQRDYEAARRHYDRALALRPSDAATMAQIGLMSGRQGRPEELTEYLERALTLDPRSTYYTHQMAMARQNIRDGAGMRRWAARALGLDPTNDTYRRLIVDAELCLRGDTVAAREFVEQADWSGPGADGHSRGLVALYRGDIERAGELWEAITLTPLQRASYLFGSGQRGSLRALADSMLAELPDTAETASRVAGRYQQHQPGRPWSQRGWLEAFRGNEEAAVRWARAGAEAVSFDLDATQHAWRRTDLMNTYVLIGDHEAALNEVGFLLSNPSGLGIGCLQLDPLYRRLRADPRFQALLAEYESR